MALGAGPGGSRASISNLVLKSTRPEAASGRHPPGPRDRPHSSASVQTRGRGPRLRAAPTPLADPSFGGDRLCGPLPPTTVQALQPGYPVACRGGLAACSKPQIAPLLGAATSPPWCRAPRPVRALAQQAGESVGRSREGPGVHWTPSALAPGHLGPRVCVPNLRAAGIYEHTWGSACGLTLGRSHLGGR